MRTFLLCGLVAGLIGCESPAAPDQHEMPNHESSYVGTEGPHTGPAADHATIDPTRDGLNHGERIEPNASDASQNGQGAPNR